MIIKIIAGLSMFDYFAGEEATVVQTLLNMFPTFGHEVLLCDINIMLTVHLNEHPGVNSDILT